MALLIPGAQVRRRAFAPPDGVTRIAATGADADGDSLFVAIPGVRVDGHDFAKEAVQAGCRLLIVERPLDLPAAQIVTPDARTALALVAAAIAGYPARRLRIVGITGTNGKTTSAYLMRGVFDAAEERCGLVGTVESIVGGQVIPATHTTPGPDSLQHLFAKMVSAGDHACAMEVSSHALSQKRVTGVDFDAAIFTNLTQDHLDYHGDFEAYFRAKRLLFAPEVGHAPLGVVNADDEHGRRLADELDLMTFAVHADADVRVRSAQIEPHGTQAEVDTPHGALTIECHLPGPFNLSNCLGVIAAAQRLGISHGAIHAGIAGVRGVPGRMEAIREGQPFGVLVDYAHTPDSLENVLKAVRQYTRGRVIVVFGCGGDRDTTKRPMMGAVGRGNSDLAIVTSDNPRSEDPATIIAQITEGATHGGDLRVEPDRRAAIAAAIEAAGDDDVVVIAGKGHEGGQETAGVVKPFDDRQVARDVLRARKDPS